MRCLTKQFLPASSASRKRSRSLWKVREPERGVVAKCAAMGSSSARADFSMVRFKTLHIEDRASVAALVREVDRANGYLYGLLESERLLGVIDAAALGNDEFDVARKYIHKE